jgi:hypothetical protein
VQDAEASLQARFNLAPKLKGIRQHHAFHVDENLLTARIYSAHTTPVLFGTSELPAGKGIKFSDLKVGDFVKFSYASSVYCGEITFIHDKDNIKINSMEPVGQNQWRWPHIKDEIFYSLKSIIHTLPKPELKSARGQYIFNA